MVILFIGKGSTHLRDGIVANTMAMYIARLILRFNGARGIIYNVAQITMNLQQ